MPYKTLRLLYMSLADSIINYGISSYGRTFKTNIQSIYNIQLRMLKSIVPLKVKYKYKNNYKKLFQYCRVINVFDKIDLAIVNEYHEKINLLHKKVRPSNLRTLINTPTYELCKCNNEYGRRSARYILPHTLNKLPKETQNNLELSNKIQTKNILKRYFIKEKYGPCVSDRSPTAPPQLN